MVETAKEKQTNNNNSTPAVQHLWASLRVVEKKKGDSLEENS
jgi:hypothetical protein